MVNETNYDTIFGRMAVEQGLCTDEELRQSLEELESRRKVNPAMLRDLLVELGVSRSGEPRRDSLKNASVVVLSGNHINNS
jgi:hypothetical protein